MNRPFVARQVAGWLVGQVARPEAGPARPKIPLARIRPFKGGSLARRNAAMGRPAHIPGGGGVRTGEAQEQSCRCSPPHPPPYSAAGPAAPACAQE
eukprot:SM008206S22701  [mRNA]  locus=s8206:280:659:+ [translate_table: standard]